MKNKPPLTQDELELFRQSISGTRKIKQDTIIAPPRTVKVKRTPKDSEITQAWAEHLFSDEFEPLLNDEGPTCYTRDDISKFELKKLRRGDYQPELFLDLHGLTQEQTKLELAALIRACIKEHLCCACISHGYGRHILKRKVPHWLVQHPSVMAFHSAPLEWGGDSALLVLIDVDSENPYHR